VFTEIWGIPLYEQNVDRRGNVAEVLRSDPLYRRMLDCEIVLRFFAFRKRANIKGAVRKMLDRCMEDHLNITEAGLATLEKDFRDRIRLARDLFGRKAFRYEDKNGCWQLSQPLYDGVMVALDGLWDRRTMLLAAKHDIGVRVSRLLRSPSAFEVVVGRPNTAKAVKKRMDLLTKAIERAI
jgi:hypothetical protein